MSASFLPTMAAMRPAGTAGRFGTPGAPAAPSSADLLGRILGMPRQPVTPSAPVRTPPLVGAGAASGAAGLTPPGAFRMPVQSGGPPGGIAPQPMNPSTAQPSGVSPAGPTAPASAGPTLTGLVPTSPAPSGNQLPSWLNPSIGGPLNQMANGLISGGQSAGVFSPNYLYNLIRGQTLNDADAQRAHSAILSHFLGLDPGEASAAAVGADTAASGDVSKALTGAQIQGGEQYANFIKSLFGNQLSAEDQVQLQKMLAAQQNQAMWGQLAGGGLTGILKLLAG